ncbi:hypothetical protein Fmac_000267 [Flemingia macrophylla]|uniref:DDE Tnp4 domain-containing protein n=1 Tax=Flemingia macrophylla TaxID=520843 RepID=A0ABD1NDS5_9FABA
MDCETVLPNTSLAVHRETCLTFLAKVSAKPSHYTPRGPPPHSRKTSIWHSSLLVPTLCFLGCDTDGKWRDVGVWIRRNGRNMKRRKASVSEEVERALAKLGPARLSGRFKKLFTNCGNAFHQWPLQLQVWPIYCFDYQWDSTKPASISNLILLKFKEMADENIPVIDLDEEDMDNGLDLNLISHIHNQLQMRTQLGAMTILCLVAFGLNTMSTLPVTTSDIRDFVSQKERRRHELISYLIHTEQCRDIIRMGPKAFINLCQRVRATGLVKDVFRSTVEEQVAKFLHIIGHNVKNRSDCLGAIDGTHVRVKVPRSDAPRFRGRKDWSTQNVFAACDFDMKFTYVLGGWEGTTSDSRILKDVLSREDPLIIP